MADAPLSTSSPAAAPLDFALRVKLSVMMFLQYAIWGAWLPLFYEFLTKHRGFSGEQTGWLFGIAAMGALVAPFVAGQIADRYLATEKFLGVSHLLGAALVWQLAGLMTYPQLLVFGVLYSIIYSPTLPLTNSLTFHHVPDRDRDFPTVRVWGTIGWICVGIGMGQWLAHQHTPSAAEASQQLVARYILAENGRQEADLGTLVQAERREQVRRAIADLNSKTKTEAQVAEELSAPPTIGETIGETPGPFTPETIQQQISAVRAAGMGDSFRLSAILGGVLGLFCFVLPHTPPQKGRAPLAFQEAFQEVKKNPLLTLFLVSFPMGCVHQFYFVHTVGFLENLKVRSPWIDWMFGYGGGPMTIGQIAEIVVLGCMGLIAKRFPRKAILIVGVLAYIARFAIFAYLPEAKFVYPALALHGLCFGCFFALAFMIIDEYTTADVRASAQSLYNLVIIGLGIIVGNIAAGYVAETSKLPDGTMSYERLFSIPMWVCVGCLAALVVFYPNRKKPSET